MQSSDIFLREVETCGLDSQRGSLSSLDICRGGAFCSVDHSSRKKRGYFLCLNSPSNSTNTLSPLRAHQVEEVKLYFLQGSCVTLMVYP